VVDVRVKKIDLPPEVSESVYNRMRAERERVARDLRAKGSEAAERIRADADRQRTVILADAYKEAEETRGKGDGLQGERRDLCRTEFFSLRARTRSSTPSTAA
jgi:membrane protease subunit HflC